MFDDSSQWKNEFDFLKGTEKAPEHWEPERGLRTTMFHKGFWRKRPEGVTEQRDNANFAKVCMCMFMCVCVYIYIYMYVYVCVYMYVYTYIWTYIYTYTYVCVCVYIYIYIASMHPYTHRHAHIHTG